MSRKQAFSDLLYPPKNLQYTNEPITLQDDGARCMKIHGNPATSTLNTKLHCYTTHNYIVTLNINTT